MSPTKNTAVIYAEEPTGHIDPDVHVKVVEQEIDLDNVPLKGGVLLKTIALSSDPYMRYRMRDPSIKSFVPAMQLGDVIDNDGVAKVLRSEDPKFKPGDYVYGYLEFSEYSVYRGESELAKTWSPLVKVENIPDIPMSVYTGALGMPGQTAYSGLKTFAVKKLKESTAIFVSGGAGPVGTFVIQYAKIINPQLKIIASAGSSEKVEFMKKCGADVAFNYKEQDTFDMLKQHGPVDFYWDNVAGPTLDAALVNLNDNGLIVACGAIGDAEGDGNPVKHFEEVFKRSITINGFLVRKGESAKALDSFYDEVIPMVKDGKIKVLEHRYHGLKEAGKALGDVHLGKNTGKAVIIVDDK